MCAVVSSSFQGVVTAATSLITTLAQKNPEEFKTSVSLAVSRLSRVGLRAGTELRVWGLVLLFSEYICFFECKVFGILFYLIFVFCLLGLRSPAYGGSQAGGRIGAVAAGLHHSHSNVGSEPRLRPTP